jgi:universal stress protein A
MRRKRSSHFAALSKKRTTFHKRGGAERRRPPQAPGMTAQTLTVNGTRERTIQPSLRFKKILAPVDFSPASKNGLNHALRFAEEFGAELTLLYVLEPPPTASFVAIPGAVAFSEPDFARAEKNLRTLVAATRREKGERPRWKIRAGVPSHEIVEAAKEGDIDLVVIATHGYTGWKHFCIGSTAERVVRAAPCPVLVVREKEHEFC